MLLSRKTSYIKRKRVPRFLLQKEDAEVQKIVYDLLGQLGIVYKKVCTARDYAWNGKRLAIRNTMSNVFHDIAHWQVASPERRSVPDFGLGKGPDSRLCASYLVTFYEAEAEEHLASVLGICIEHTLLAGTKRVDLWESTAIDHGWLDRDSNADVSWDSFKKEANKQLEYLSENRLIDSDFNYLMG